MSASDEPQTVAMEEEAKFLDPLIEKGLVEQPPIRGIVKSFRGEVDGLTVDVVVSGIGAVFAASAMTAALSASPAMAVISCGCSGAHIPEQRMGDIVIGSTVVPLQAEVVDRHGKSRLAGVRCLMTEEHTKEFVAHPVLLRLATEAAHAVSAEIGGEGAAPAPRVDVGAVGSSDLWRQSPALIAETHAAHKTLCEEMEAHALAQVCRVFEVPFVSIKDVANSEIHPEPIQLDPIHHLVPDTCQVGLHAARVTARALKLIAANPSEVVMATAEAAGPPSPTRQLSSGWASSPVRGAEGPAMKAAKRAATLGAKRATDVE